MAYFFQNFKKINNYLGFLYFNCKFAKKSGEILSTMHMTEIFAKQLIVIKIVCNNKGVKLLCN
jgi:hypothetical protein